MKLSSYFGFDPSLRGAFIIFLKDVKSFIKFWVGIWILLCIILLGIFTLGFFKMKKAGNDFLHWWGD